MAYWHETVREKGSVIFHGAKGNVAAIYSGFDIRNAPFEGHFLRWEGEGTADRWGWRRQPQGWYVLQPIEPLLVSSNDEMRAKYESLKSAVEDGSLDSTFNLTPYIAPTPAPLIKEIRHPIAQAQARIFLVSDKRYYIQYLVYAPDQKYYPAQTPSVGELGWEWGLPRKGNETFADDLASAEEIAILELNEIAASDPEIKPRDIPLIDD